ncbi:hypothetical protein ACNI3K_00490 [Demequina sp. SO4-13]|uniref:hypothetical protein n=1 Tax=Demequina sp. SO4-13 TaxID=3401027 RepID=UPI003AF914FC
MDDDERATCERCAWEAGLPDSATPLEARFEDDRGDLDLPEWDRDAMPWPHRRWLDRAGRLHREDPNLPALESSTWEIWAQHGRITRDHKPAVVRGDDWAYVHKGEIHRGGGLPAVCWDQRFEHWERGVITRDDGPAIYGRGPARFIFNGGEHSRDEAWAHWCHLQVGLSPDNTGAVTMLDRAFGPSGPTGAFPTFDANDPTVRLALRLHRDL